MTLKQLFFSLEGRIGRKVFWLKCILPLVAGTIVVAVIDGLAGLGGILLIIWNLSMLWSSIAIQAKRWHDRDKSAWWVLIGLIPIIGQIWSFVETGCLKGTTGDNRFGPDPLIV